MVVYKYEELKNSPIVQGSVYQYGEGGGFGGDPLHELVNVGNKGGIRPRNNVLNSDKKAYIVLQSTDNPIWKNRLDPNSNDATYFGDNKTPDCDPRESRGNKALIKVYSYMQKGFCTPLLIFKKNENPSGLEFFSLAIPHINPDGTPGYEEVDSDSEGNPVRNFKFRLDLIKTGNLDLRPLLNELRLGKTDFLTHFKKTNNNYIPNETVTGPRLPKQKEFLEFLHKRGFIYDPSFVVDFLLGLKAKQFMIFCGGTGTGKTKLAQLYEQYYDIETALVPVGPNWTECRYITGFINAITGAYSSTATSEIIKNAEVYPDHPHFLILDEMNLSHIERYFSEILSVMESEEPITLGNEDATLGNNLFIIGTINVDETTYSISPKVLDRANVMTFNPADVDNYLGCTDTINDIDGDWEFLENCMVGLDIRMKKAPELFKEINVADHETVNNIRQLLSKIQKAMSKMDLPLGYRTIDEISRFLYAAWIFERKGKFSSWKHYMDSQIMMRILPKIHGDAKIADGLKDLLEICAEFSRSNDSVKKMLHTLTNRRYTSFIC